MWSKASGAVAVAAVTNPPRVPAARERHLVKWLGCGGAFEQICIAARSILMKVLAPTSDQVLLDQARTCCKGGIPVL